MWEKSFQKLRLFSVIFSKSKLLINVYIMQSFGRAVTSKALIQLFYLIRSLHVLRSFCHSSFAGFYSNNPVIKISC